jgi:hypothetical protein
VKRGKKTLLLFVAAKKIHLLITSLLLLCAIASRAVAAARDVYQFHPGVHFSKEHPMTNKQVRTLLAGLRFWTGFNEIGIDASGDLTLGNRLHITSGSATARELIIAAVASQDSFTLENCDRSPAVAFTRIVSTLVYQDSSNARHDDWKIQVDFADFDQLRGDPHALATFDPAINVLHELVHGVLRYPDPIDVDDRLGQCERHVNRIREELGLPRRQEYYPRNERVMPSTGIASLQSEISFVDPKWIREKTRDLRVSFFAKDVVDARKIGKSEIVALAPKRASY